MDLLATQLEFYDSCHQNTINQWTHVVGLPMIIVGVMMFFSWIRLDFFAAFNTAISWLIVLAILVYYFLLDKKVAAIMALVYIIPNWLVGVIVGQAPSKTSFIVFLVLFVGGWILQFVGHLFEKQRPAFFSSLIQLLIGPIYFVNKLARKLGIELT